MSIRGLHHVHSHTVWRHIQLQSNIIFIRSRAPEIDMKIHAWQHILLRVRVTQHRLLAHPQKCKSEVGFTTLLKLPLQPSSWYALLLQLSRRLNLRTAIARSVLLHAAQREPSKVGDTLTILFTSMTCQTISQLMHLFTLVNFAFWLCLVCRTSPLRYQRPSDIRQKCHLQMYVQINQPQFSKDTSRKMTSYRLEICKPTGVTWAQQTMNSIGVQGFDYFSGPACRMQRRTNGTRAIRLINDRMHLEDDRDKVMDPVIPRLRLQISKRKRENADELQIHIRWAKERKAAQMFF